MAVIEIIIPGEPTPKGRPRIGINRGTGRAVAFTPAKTVNAEATIAFFASQAMAGRAPFDGPISMEVTAYRAKGMPGKASAKPGTKSRTDFDRAEAGFICPTSKPDADNYLKTAQDALNGVVFADDAQVIDAIVRKRYSARPRLVIVVIVQE